MENIMETPLKTKNKLPYDPSTPLLDIYLEEALIWKDTCIPIFIAALFTIVKTRSQPKCPLTDEWKRKKVVHIYNGILKGRDITLLTKVHLVKAMVFPEVMCRCENWTIKKVECCWGSTWGTPPVAKVMRKEARHTQRQNQASGVPLEILEHLPP